MHECNFAKKIWRKIELVLLAVKIMCLANGKRDTIKDLQCSLYVHACGGKSNNDCF